MPAIPLNLSSHWTALRVMGRREHTTAELLVNRHGMEAYCPRSPPYPHQDRVSLFPGYMFARVSPHHWYWLRGLDTVLGYVLAPDRQQDGLPAPCHIPDHAIKELRAREAALEDIRFKPHQRMRVDAGPFRGQIGELLRYVDDRNVELALHRFGRVRIAAESVGPWMG
jgi:transcription antitermination factor NusG